MTGRAGDRISVDSSKVGMAPREGEILEVLESPAGPRYRVRWADGHESDIRPAGGTARIMPAPTKTKLKRA